MVSLCSRGCSRVFGRIKCLTLEVVTLVNIIVDAFGGLRRALWKHQSMAKEEEEHTWYIRLVFQGEYVDFGYFNIAAAAALGLVQPCLLQTGAGCVLDCLVEANVASAGHCPLLYPWRHRRVHHCLKRLLAFPNHEPLCVFFVSQDEPSCHVLKLHHLAWLHRCCCFCKYFSLGSFLTCKLGYSNCYFCLGLSIIYIFFCIVLCHTLK